ncbi:10750_t:CDS:10 [Funneliformis caledonium]|uniref:Rab3 GTPase-activating protein catalytic subunit n=1 Tax=Funneliformis caledonium TaxID=1117310 RepID=A0A9N9BF40_9GLOM|nr:10750_t:CDS:10 [Funneliformis caledonium]
MHASYPNSPIDDDEHFEFVDYTAASHWERFITTVEEVLTGWGVNDGQLGIFDESKLPPLGDKISTKIVGGIDPFVKREIIILDDTSYTLSYHYHPIKRWNEFAINHSPISSGSTLEPPPPPPITTLFPPNPDTFLPSSEFLPISLPNTSLESTSMNLSKIHRWTGLTHILVLSPTDIFSTGATSKSTSIDLHTTKMLLSSFAIAFHNTKCKLPVYVPNGQVANSLYAGYMCLFNKEVKNVNDASEVEIRFNTTYVRDVPARFSHLTGLTELFIEKMDLNKCPLDQVDVPELDKMPHLGIAVAGLFKYELQNLDDQDWKNLDENELNSTPLNLLNNKKSSFEENIFKEFENHSERTFGNGEAKDSSRFSHSTVDQFTSSIASVPNLPFGPPNDPLQSLSLTAFFPSAPRDTYLDNDVYSEVDAVRAPIWILACNFYPEHQLHALLSSILDATIISLDCNDEIAEKSNNSKGKLRNKSFKKGQITDIPGTFKSYDLISYDTVRYASSAAGGIVDMDDVDIDNILNVLFHPLSNKILPNNYDNTLNGIPLSASSLGLNFRDARTVPYKSFLWNLLECLLETVSPMTSSRGTFLGSLKILWNEIIREIRRHWERVEPLPDVNIYNMSENENESSIIHQNDSLTIDDNKVKNSTVEKTNLSNIGIDMRFNLIHQKLCMMNCCIARMRQYQKYNPILSTSPSSIKHRVSSNNSLDSMSNKINKNSPLEQKQTIDPFVRLFDHITGDDEIATPGTSASMVLVPRVNSNGASNSEVCTLAEKEVKFPSHNHSASIDYVPMPSVGELEEEYFDAIEEATSTPLGIPRGQKNTIRSASQHRRSPSSFSHIHSNSPTTSLFSEQSDPNPHASSLSESFIQLNYSSSMESNQGFEFAGRNTRSEMGKMSLNDDKEVKDENEREGNLYHFNNLTLLKTGKPLWVPETQDMGFMTEDMVREQEELFENLGSSEDAAKIRAQLHSAHLKSDMQAFKAANPHAVLEDFVRWHSPRDWIVDEGGDPNKGALSLRMKEKGNLWQELWKSSKRIPARRQKPLFKFTREGEKVLHYLENLSVQDLFKQLLPTIFLIAYDSLVSQSVSKNIKPISSGLTALAQELLDFPWNDVGTKNIVCDGLIQSFRQNEMLIGKAISLLRKLPNQYNLVERLLEIPETQVLDGKERETVYGLFASGAPLNDSFPHPTTREFVLQTTCLRPTPVPARMYVSLDNSGMRIVDMVGKDTVFM